MYEDKEMYMQAQNALTPAGYEPPTARNQLLKKKAALEKELGFVQGALEALDKYPELEHFTETLKAALR